MNKKILILNTGGTISSIPSDQGYLPVRDYIHTVLSSLVSLHHPDMPTYDIKEYDPLLDSSNMGVSEWNQIAEDLATNYDAYDGFLIFHGTDTMAYTASALSFMLENLTKPVLITGSQIPLSQVRNDAIDNICTSLWIIAHLPIPEVCIYFNQSLLRGNRCQKVSAQHFKAFNSPNFPHLADIGIEIELNQQLILAQPTQPFAVQTIKPHLVANVRLFPGFSMNILAAILQQPIKGLILETYGAGNAPNNDPYFLHLLSDANERGVVIVNCTQCPHGEVQMHQYATGHTLKDVGVISGFDLTLEAAHCKLLVLLSKNYSVEHIKYLMQKNIIGELTH